MRNSLSRVLLFCALLFALPSRADWAVAPKSGVSTTTSLKAVSMTSAAEAWAVGGTSGQPGSILSTTDAFTSASSYTPGAGNVLNAVWAKKFGAATTVHAWGSGNSHASTQDGGATWDASPSSIASLNVFGVSFLDATTGYLCGQAGTSSALVKVSGSTYTSLNSSLATALTSSTTIMRGLTYSALDTGWIVGGTDVVKQTGPTSFTKVIGNSSGVFKAIAFSPDGSVGMAVGTSIQQGVAVFDSAFPNGHAATTPPTQTSLNSVAVPANKVAVVVGASGFIGESVDGGLTWRQRGASLTTSALNGVSCFDIDHCIAVGDNGTLLSFTNSPPTANVTSDLGGFSVNENQTICLSVSASDPDGDPVTVRWTDPNGFNDGATTPTVCIPPRTGLCADTPLQRMTVAITDGRDTITKNVDIVVRDTDHKPPTLTLDKAAYSFTPGQVYTANASVAFECSGDSGTVTFTTSQIPAPASTTSTSATFDLRNYVTCTGDSGTLTASVTDTKYGLTSTATAGVTIARNAVVPLTMSLSNASVSLTDGQSQDVKVTASQCPNSQLSYSWSCAASNATDTQRFTHPGGLCTAQASTCTVTVTSQTDGATATKTVSVGYAASPIPVSLNASPTSGGTLDAQTRTAVATFTANRCPGDTFSYAINCSDPSVLVDAANGKVTFTHSGAVCADTKVTCNATAKVTTPGMVGADGPAQFELTYLKNDFAPTVSLPTSTATLTDAAKSATLTGSWSRCPNDTPTFKWTCTDPSILTNANSASATFTTSGKECANRVVTCDFTATVNGLTSAPATATVTLEANTFPPDFDSTTVTDIALDATTPTATRTPKATHCNEAITYSWSGTGCVAPFLMVNNDTATFTHPLNLCTADAVQCTVTAQAAGGPSASKTLNVTRAEIPFAPTVSLPTSTATLTDAATSATLKGSWSRCPNDTPTFKWTCTDSSILTNANSASATVTTSGKECANRVVTCDFRATVNGLTSAPATATVTLEANTFPPDFDPTTVTDVSLDAKTPTATRTPKATHCNEAITYSWSGTGCVAPLLMLNNDTATFTHSLRQCAPDTVKCTVTAKAASGVTAQKDIDVALAETPFEPSVTISATPTTSVQPGASLTLDAQVSGCTGQTYDYAWSCPGWSGITLPNQQKVTPTHTPPMNMCSDQQVTCSVTVTPQRTGWTGLTDTASVPVTLLEPADMLSFTTVPTVSKLDVGRPQTAKVAASRRCGTTTTYAWTCDPVGAQLANVVTAGGTTDTATLTHPGESAQLCGEKTVDCTVTASSDTYTATQKIPVTVAAAWTPPTKVSVQSDAPAGGKRGDTLHFTVTSDSACPANESYLWTTKLLPSGAPGPTGKGNTFALLLPGCATSVEVTAAAERGGASASIVLPVSDSASPPQIAAPSFNAPWLSSSLDCHALAPVVIAPQVSAECSASMTWRQLTDLPVDLAPDASGSSLSVSVPPEHFADVVGRTGRFELSVSDQGTTATQVFEAHFSPGLMTHLALATDRTDLPPGEVATVEVRVTNDCAQSLPAMDLHLLLEGLEILPGSATVDGAPLADPTVPAVVVENDALLSDFNRLVLHGVPLPGSATPGPLIRLQARRTLASNSAASLLAEAFLPDSDERISPPASALNVGDGSAGLQVAACGCESASGGLTALALPLVALGLRRRKRAA